MTQPDDVEPPTYGVNQQAIVDLIPQAILDNRSYLLAVPPATVTVAATLDGTNTVTGVVDPSLTGHAVTGYGVPGWTFVGTVTATTFTLSSSAAADVPVAATSSGDTTLTVFVDTPERQQIRRLTRQVQGYLRNTISDFDNVDEITSA